MATSHMRLKQLLIVIVATAPVVTPFAQFVIEVAAKALATCRLICCGP